MATRTTLHSDLSYRSRSASGNAQASLPPAASASRPHHERVVSNTSEAPSLTQQQRLSRMSCSTKNAVTLNQLQRVEIPASYVRGEDGARMYVIEVSLKPYQAGIPNARMSAEFIDGHFLNRDTAMSANSSTSLRSIVPQPPPSSHTDSSNVTERNNSSSSRASRNKDKHASTSPKSPAQYQITYRYSAFRELRTRVLNAVEENDRHHLKWCWYCNKIQWAATFGPFPSRHPLLHLLAKRSRCGESLERVLLDRLWRRHHRLALFVNDVLESAKDASYRYQSSQCECFSKVAVIVINFLAEPHLRAPATDDDGEGAAW